MPGLSSNTAGSVLSRDLTAFLVEFSVALHKHAIYPSGHPSLEPAAVRLAEQAAQLLKARATLAFGVARQQLIIDGVATDPNHPVLRRLASTLHQHQLGAMTILNGVTAGEILGALRALADESPDADAARRPVDRQHVRFHPLTLDCLEIVDEGATDVQDVVDSEPRRRRAQLWVGLANAALARDVEFDVRDTPPEPDEVARAMDDRIGAEAYDQVIIGYMLQIAEELKNSPAADHGALRRRTARLIRALRPETLQRLVTMGGNTTQRKVFVSGVTTGMAMDSVVKILKAAADASGQTVSHGLIRMLSKMAAHAERGEEVLRPVAEKELREQVDSLLTGWRLDDPNPGMYTQALQHLSTNVAPRETVGSDEEMKYDLSPMHVVQMALEVGGTGPVIERGIERALEAGHLHSLHALLTFLPPGAEMTANLIRERLGGARAMEVLVAQEPLDLKLLDALAPFGTIESYAVLLDALITTNNRVTRRHLLERLAKTDLDVAPLVVARLEGDDRWYVQRNLLVLLERLRRVPPGFDMMRWTQHDDPRVRYHGFSLQLSLGARETVIHGALSDRDERVRRLGLATCRDDCPPSMIPLVATLAADVHAGPELRMMAIKVLGACRDPHALGTLLALVNGGKNWLGKPKLAPRSALVLASLRALSGVWATDAEASRLLQLAQRSSDPELRQAAQAGRV